MTVFVAVAAATAAVALVATGCGGDNAVGASPMEPSGPTVETEKGTATPYGRDAGQVWVLRPRAGELRSVVVYLHGYGAYLPFEWHLHWMNHLLENGSAVVFPRYQSGAGDDPFVRTPADLADGLRTGFAALGDSEVPVVAAGFSLGATLAFVYAVRAEEWGVPAPRAVYSVYPVDPRLVDPELDLSTIDDVNVQLLAGDNDVVVGQEGARNLMRGLTGLSDASKQLTLVRTTEKLIAEHESPTRVDLPEVRDIFWTRLDELVDQARLS